MYRRDQQEKHSLSSYFDEKNGSTSSTTVVTSPVSPLATNVTMARTQTRIEQHVQPSGTSGGKQQKGCEEQHAGMDVQMYVYVYIV